MLKLKNVSKFYYNKGVIASGFNKINVEFNIGEFVVITGESGSGKSTLLNVISGLDSYEEGEMYIDGCETSHYRESDFEEYRKKYVSNIFQSFNLVNSYTVYQNIELVLLLNGFKKKDIKNKVLELIDRVKLTKYKNTKVSKLSGGQKQRVAIARALAKDTPIIVCDEPTGNLDSKASREIISILKEISNDKLVIMVTHDYSSIKDVATRVIKMHDGKILSDKKNINGDYNDKDVVLDNKYKGIGLFNIIRLGVRNTFNIIPKFVLIFIVNLFITTSLLTVYGSLKKNEYEISKTGYNYYFSDVSDTRIVIKKKDGSKIDSSEIEDIKKLDKVDYIEENDLLVDNYVWFESINNYEFSTWGLFKNIDKFEGELDYGRMPTADNEIIYVTYADDYYFTERLDDALNETYYLQGDKNNTAVKIVGIKYIDNSMFYLGDSYIYGNKELLDEYMVLLNLGYSDIVVNINNKNYSFQTGFIVVPNDKVSSGNAIVSEEISYACKNYNCKNQNILVNVSNIYYSDSLNLKISNVYNNKNVSKLLGINKDHTHYGQIFINTDDYNNLYNKGTYQTSVYVSRGDYVDSVSDKLSKLGYETLQIRNTLSRDNGDNAKIMKIVKLVVIVCLVLTLFAICYFVMKLILKSRNVYFSTVRILGGSSRHIKRILDVELFVNANIAYFTYILFLILIKNKIIDVSFLSNVVEYLNIFDFIFMYLILVVMSYLISSRFSSKIFKKSAMKSYRDEV